MTSSKFVMWVDDSPGDPYGQFHDCYYYPNGQLKNESHRRGSGMGLPDGLQLEFYENGQIKYFSAYTGYKYTDGSQSPYINHLGEHKEWYENGNLKEEGYYKDDYPQGLFKKYCEDGKLSEFYTYDNKKKNGEYETYYCKTDTQIYTLEEKGTYVDGKIDGSRERYYSNGHIAEKITFKDGKYDGPYESYNSDGTIKKKGNLKKQ
ncbi:MAG: hypothetical protein HQK67_08655 [Desulfamplus sp.]|nr:hypothetical protein [Desulfamplus sp.]